MHVSTPWARCDYATKFNARRSRCQCGRRPCAAVRDLLEPETSCARGRLARWLQGRRGRGEHSFAPPRRSCETRRDQFRRQSQALGISANTSRSVGTIYGTSNIASIPTDANKPGRHHQYRKCSRHENRCTTKGRLYLVTSRIAGSESEGRMGRCHCHHGLRCRFRAPPVRKPKDRGQDSSLIIMARCHRAGAGLCQPA